MSQKEENVKVKQLVSSSKSPASSIKAIQSTARGFAPIHSPPSYPNQPPRGKRKRHKGDVPPDADVPTHADWGPELEKRVAEIESGTATSVSWSKIRDEALARIGHGNGEGTLIGTNLR